MARDIICALNCALSTAVLCVCVDSLDDMNR